MTFSHPAMAKTYSEKNRNCNPENIAAASVTARRQLCHSFPANGKPACSAKQHNCCAKQDHHFGLQCRHRRAVPKDFVVTIKSPGIERETPDLLHRFAHDIPWHHASTHCRHRQNDHHRHRIQLPACPAHRCQQQCETC